MNQTEEQNTPLLLKHFWVSLTNLNIILLITEGDNQSHFCYSFCRLFLVLIEYFATGPELASGWANRRPVTADLASTSQNRSRLSAKTEALKAQVRLLVDL